MTRTKATTCSKQKLRLAVEAFGGKLVTNDGGRFIEYELEAPAGSRWADGSGAHVLVVTSGYHNVENEARVDALSRVSNGIEKCPEDCDCFE